jgi:hypothetical protein
VVDPSAQGLHDSESTWELCLRVVSNALCKTDGFYVNEVSRNHNYAYRCMMKSASELSLLRMFTTEPAPEPILMTTASPQNTWLMLLRSGLALRRQCRLKKTQNRYTCLPSCRVTRQLCTYGCTVAQSRRLSGTGKRFPLRERSEHRVNMVTWRGLPHDEEYSLHRK